jgi:hypothetical protein
MVDEQCVCVCECVRVVCVVCGGVVCYAGACVRVRVYVVLLLDTSKERVRYCACSFIFYLCHAELRL